MTSYTVDDVMARGPCWTRERVEEGFGGAQALSLPEMLRREDVPAADRVWLGLALRPDVAVRFAGIVADRAVRTYALPCQATAEWAERWLSGEDRSEAAASAAAWSAADAAAAASASRAAWAGAWAAWAGTTSADEAAGAATRAASSATRSAWAAANRPRTAAAQAAAREEEERATQIADLIALVQEVTE